MIKVGDTKDVAIINTPRIAVLDQNEVVLTYIDNNATDALHLSNETFDTYLKGTAYTLKATLSNNRSEFQYIKTGYKLAFKYAGLDYSLNIVETFENGLNMEITAFGLSLELVHSMAESYVATKPMTFAEYWAKTDPEGSVKIGLNEISTVTKTLSLDQETTKLERLFTIADAFDAEVEIKVELSPYYKVSKYVINVYKAHTASHQGIGQRRTDYVVEYGRNSDHVTRTIKSQEVYTAILAKNNNKLDLRNYVATEKDENGYTEYFTFKGSGWIYAPHARDRYPSNLTGSNSNDRYTEYIWTYTGDVKDTSKIDSAIDSQQKKIETKKKSIADYTKAHNDRLAKLNKELADLKAKGASAAKIKSKQKAINTENTNYSKKLAEYNKELDKLNYDLDTLKRQLADLEEYDLEMLYKAALDKLKEISVPAMTYEAPGYHPLNIGDTVRIQDHTYDPVLLLEARVESQSTCWTKPESSKTVFSNFIELKNKVSSTLIAAMEELIEQNKLYVGEIIADGPITFKNGKGEVYLAAVVKNGPVDVTDKLTINWYKDGSPLAVDTGILVKVEDVPAPSIYRFQAFDSSDFMRASAEVGISNVDELTYQVGGAAPEEDEDKTIWVDTSKAGQLIPGANYYDPITGEWVTTTPSKPEHVGAYPDERGQQLAADFAVNDAILAQAKADLEKAKADLIQNAKDIAANNEKLASAKGELDTTKADLVKTAADLEENKKKLETAKVDLEQTITDLSQTKTDLATTKTDLETAKTNIANDKKYIDSVKAQADAMSGRIDEQQTVVDASNTLANAAKLVADESKKASTTATSLANEAKGLADSASQNASTAKTNAATAVSNASTAMANAKTSLDKANSVDQTVQTEVTRINGELSSKATQTSLNTLSGTVTNQGTQITQNKNNIALKANQTTVDTLSGTVSSQGTQITQNKNDIALRATTSTVSTLTGRVSAAESSISVNANSITSLVTKTDGTNTQLSSLKQTVSGFQTDVYQNYASLDALKRSKLAGDNLIIGPGEWTGDGASYEWFPDTVSLRITFNGTATNRIYKNASSYGNGTAPFDQLFVGDYFSMSFKAYANVDGAKIRIGTFYDYQEITLSKNTQYFEVKAIKMTTNSNALSIVGVGSGYVVRIDELMVVSGTLPKAYAPSIFDNNYKISSLKQDVDGFKATVASTYETKAIVESKVSNVAQSVEGFKTTVAQTYSTKGDLATTNAKVTTLEQNVDGFKTTVASIKSNNSLIQNGSFDSDLYWNLGNSMTIQKSTLGMNYLKMDSTGGTLTYFSYKPGVDMKANRTYEISYSVYLSPGWTGTSETKFRIGDGQNGNAHLWSWAYNSIERDKWTDLTYSITPGRDVIGLIVGGNANTSSGFAAITNIAIRDITDITKTNSKVTTLEQNVDGFKTTVAQTYSTKTDLNALKSQVEWQTLSTSPDLNTMTTNGYFFMKAGTNSPVSGWIYLSVDKATNTRIKQQVAYDADPTRVWTRIYNGSWSAWLLNADEKDISGVTTKITTLEQNVNGFKTIVAQTYATQTELGKKLTDLSYITSTTSNTYSGQWVRFLRTDVKVRYAEAQISLDIMSGGSGDGIIRSARVNIRHKHQDPLGTHNPTLFIYVDNQINFNAEWIKGFLVQNTETGGSSIDYYIYMDTSFLSYGITPYQATGSGSISYVNNGGFLANPDATVKWTGQDGGSYALATQIKQTVDTIDASVVKKDKVVSSINLNPEGIRLQGKLITLDGTSYIATGVIADAHIANATIQTGSIKDAAISNAKIADLAVTNAKIANLAVTGAKIAQATIEDANIKNGTILSASIGDAQITNAKIADLAVTGAKIAKATIVDANIQDASIQTVSIKDGAITNAKIGDLAVTNAKIANAAITDAKIANAAITNAHIRDATISSAKIQSLEADKVNASTLSAITANLGNVTAGTITGSVSITSGSTSTGQVTLANGVLKSVIGAGSTQLSPTGLSNYNTSNKQGFDLNFTSQGMSVSALANNTGLYRNVGFDLYGDNTYIDFHSKNTTGADPGRIWMKDNKEFEMYNSEGQMVLDAQGGSLLLKSKSGSVNLQGASVNVRNYDNSGYVTAYATLFKDMSAHSMKEDFVDLDVVHILEEIRKMDIVGFKYKTEPTRHIGFVINDDGESPYYTPDFLYDMNTTSYSPGDVANVALVAIKELLNRVDILERRVGCE